MSVPPTPPDIARQTFFATGSRKGGKGGKGGDRCAGKWKTPPSPPLPAFTGPTAETVGVSPPRPSSRPRQTFFATGLKKGGKVVKPVPGRRETENTPFTTFTAFFRADCGNCRANCQPCPAADPATFFATGLKKGGKGGKGGAGASGNGKHPLHHLYRLSPGRLRKLSG